MVAFRVSVFRSLRPFDGGSSNLIRAFDWSPCCRARAVPSVPGGGACASDAWRWAPQDLPHEALGHQRGSRQEQVLVSRHLRASSRFPCRRLSLFLDLGWQLKCGSYPCAGTSWGSSRRLRRATARSSPSTRYACFCDRHALFSTLDCSIWTCRPIAACLVLAS